MHNYPTKPSSYATNEKGIPQEYFWSERELLQAMILTSWLYHLQIDPSLREGQPKGPMSNQVIITPCLQLCAHVIDISMNKYISKKELM